MIRRKDTLGYIDFMRGKYSIFNRPYITNMLNQMTVEEKTRMRSGDFGLLWQAIWGKPLPAAAAAAAAPVSQYRSEELTSRDKYNLLFSGVFHSSDPERKFWSEKYTLNDLIDASDPGWEEPEWGFPKGRRNPQEKDYECAMREFTEETGISAYRHLHNVQNLMPYEEIFTGSNYKSYKHKYYVMFLNQDQYNVPLDQFESSEVSLMAWKTLDQARQCIRPYNLEKLRVLDHVERTLKKFPVMSTK
jgi:8-oxo-dGTP pyrophosphatase MutT (NUDIX family)